jgi:hypothetical protein
MSKWKLSLLPLVALTLACSASGPQADSPNTPADPARVAGKDAGLARPPRAPTRRLQPIPKSGILS